VEGNFEWGELRGDGKYTSKDGTKWVGTFERDGVLTVL